ncbi:hypothetical protein [Nocardioides sp. B-3]|uniref:hypothetical protein n=1 Tax=Nocardioides sp. B-3 TaxID=2895565 RepID=UPI0021524BDD|nr:hypothetical protein [Nocardioides sp. B-3]UUZ57913.1 hypothetical protein LP418_16305 [Nocardioides sp. B-3]
MNPFNKSVGPVLAGLLLSGCSERADPASGSSDPDPNATQSDSPTPGETASQTPVETETTQAVAPAAGPRLSVKGLSVNAPEGWEAKAAYSVMAAAVPKGLIGTTVYVFRFPNSGLVDSDQLARASRRETGWKSALERLDDVELDGQPAFHPAGNVNPGEYIEKFGAIVNDDRLTVTFEFRNNESDEVKDQIIASVPATAEYGS